MSKVELHLQLPDETDVEINADDSSSDPMLARAGILDVNKLFSSLPEWLIEKCGAYPDINTLWMNSLIFERTHAELKRLGLVEYQREGFDSRHFLYPIIQGGFVHALAETALFRRLFRIHQLGLARYYPLRNLHTRGEHSIYLAINMIRCLQSLATKAPGLLAQKLRADFTQEGLIEETICDEERLIEIAGDLTVLVAMLHDAATPAGGDTFKYLLGIDEEEELRVLLERGRMTHSEEVDEIMNLVAARGLRRKHIDYAIRCIQGKSKTLIGQMIHASGKDELDFDRMAYTILDCKAGRIFDAQEISHRLLPGQFSNKVELRLLDQLIVASECLNGEYIAVSGLSTTNHIPANLLDVSEEYVLDELGRLVCTRPDKLGWLAAYRIWMTGCHYAGYKMLGLEYELQRHLQTLLSQRRVGGILPKERLLKLTDDELFLELDSLGDQRLSEILARNKAFAGTTQFTGALVDNEDQAPPKYHVIFPVAIKPGLDSLVHTGECTITLKQWMLENPQLYASQATMTGISTFQGKKVVIYQSNN